MVQEPATYEDWKRQALAEDASSGAEAWKSEQRTRLYDHDVIRRRFDELVEIRGSGDAQRLLYYLNEGLHGNMGGMGSPALYARARFGTKHLVCDYIDEIVAALHDLESITAAEIGFEEKQAYFRRASDCFGRSALMLSGAGSLGAFHIGVARALVEQDLLPQVISGASAGSIVAAMLGTHSGVGLERIFSDTEVAKTFDLLRGSSERSGARIQIDDLRAMIEWVVPDMTFQEALEETGCQINVSVAPASLHQRSRLLNASTSPNAFLREAVLASCAIPGMFPPVTLAAKDISGKRRPYVPSRQWVDGSITDDLPAKRLARLYGVNHFISSQANPIVLWALQDPHASQGLPGRLVDVSLTATREWLRAWYPFAMRMVRGVHPVDTYTRLWFSVATQDYTSDVNIVPRQRLFSPGRFLSPLSREDASALVSEGERATWPKIELVRNCTKVSRCIDAIRVRLRPEPSSVATA
ncbi:MAG: DUF3336 domain-containing protein [Myxococcota bacterium]